MESTIPFTYFIAVSAILFIMGALGVLIRRNALIVFMSIELMLNAANLSFVAFWRYGPDPSVPTGLMFALFSIAVAAAEAEEEHLQALRMLRYQTMVH